MSIQAIKTVSLLWAYLILIVFLGCQPAQVGSSRATAALGDFYWHEGAYNRALSWYQETVSRDTWVEDATSVKLGIVHINMGVTYVNKGEYKHALWHYREAQRIMKKVTQVKPKKILAKKVKERVKELIADARARGFRGRLKPQEPQLCRLLI